MAASRNQEMATVAAGARIPRRPVRRPADAARPAMVYHRAGSGNTGASRLIAPHRAIAPRPMATAHENGR
ncbi:hypothetical protein QWZ18_20175, partial [Methylobacterium longum]|nr:hypothetical protein [Methylobacterium longum]